MFYGIDSLTLSIAVFCGLLLLFAAVKHYTKKWFLPPEGWILLLGLGYGISGRYTGWRWQPELALEPHICLSGISCPRSAYRFAVFCSVPYCCAGKEAVSETLQFYVIHGEEWLKRR